MSLLNMDVSSLHQLPGTVTTCRIGHERIKFFINNFDDPIQNAQSRGEFFEAEELQLIAKHIAPGSIIADIGSNVGNHALFFEKFMAPRSVVLFEVNPDAIAILMINRLLNECRSWNYDYIGFALSDQASRMRRVPPNDNNMGATQFIPDAGGSYRSIIGDQILCPSRVDFIKIDVEGGEMAVLGGLSATVSTWRPTLFVEVGDYHFDQFDAWMQQHDYTVAEKFERYAGLPNYMIKSNS